MKKQLLLACLLLSALVSIAQSVTIYRSGSATTPTYTSIKNAVAASISGDSLVFSADTFKENKIIIDKNLSLTGTSTATAMSTIDATHDSTAIMLLAGISLKILDLNICNGSAKDNAGKGGGAVCADALSVLTLDGQSHFYQNEATATAPNGGAIYSEGTVIVTGSSRIAHNYATENGGGIYSVYFLALSQGSFLDSNTALISGGGIYSTNTVQVQHTSMISRNSAQTGGGITMLNGVLSVSNNSSITANKTQFHGGAIALFYSYFTMSDSSMISYNTTDTNYAAAIYAKGNNDLYVFGGQIIGNHSSKTDAVGTGMAIYNDSASGGSSVVSVSRARIFNPRSDFSRQNELYNLHEASAFLTDSTWWGESDTTGLIYNHPAALTSYRTWVIADWRVNNDAPVTGLSSFPVEAQFRLSTGLPLPPHMFWMLNGDFSTDLGSFSPVSVPMSVSNKIGSTFTIPASSTTVNLQAVVDADTFRKAVWILVVSIKERSERNSAISIYPNPGNGDMTIKIEGNKPERVRVLDLNGRVMYSGSLSFTANSSSLQLDLPNGQYLLCLDDDKGLPHYEQISIKR